MSIAIRVNGRRRSAPPVGPFTVTITNCTLDPSYFEYGYVSPDGGTTQYSAIGSTFSATILFCKAWFGPSGTNHVYFNGTEQTLTGDGECAITLTGDCNVSIVAQGAGSGVTITITNV